MNSKQANQLLEERLERWRLILGGQADKGQEISLPEQVQGVDDVLDALYDSEKKAGLGRSSPNINRWLGDIRKYFPTAVVQLMQKDALERLGLERMLLEPELLESVEPDVHLVGTLLALKKVLPSKTRETARVLVRKVVEELEKRLRYPMEQAIRGSLHRAQRTRRPRHNEIDWHQTIRVNLKHYQESLQTIIPELLLGHGRKRQQMKQVVLLIDQSGSMVTSVVYASVFGAILASMRTIRTHLVVFDTSVVDLSQHLDDPVELLFSTQLGGGTNINKAMAYAEQIIDQPLDTILILISDLFEGGSEEDLLRRSLNLKASGVQLINLLALNDEGAPAFNRMLAAQFAQLDIPAFACTPDVFPDLMAAAIQKQDLNKFKT